MGWPPGSLTCFDDIVKSRKYSALTLMKVGPKIERWFKQESGSVDIGPSADAAKYRVTKDVIKRQEDVCCVCGEKITVLLGKSSDALWVILIQVAGGRHRVLAALAGSASAFPFLQFVDASNQSCVPHSGLSFSDLAPWRWCCFSFRILSCRFVRGHLRP